VVAVGEKKLGLVSTNHLLNFDVHDVDGLDEVEMDLVCFCECRDLFGGRVFLLFWGFQHRRYNLLYYTDIIAGLFMIK
jgi:hypothetical protein